MDRAERLKENQETFKRANERLGSVVAERASAVDRVPFLCECADEACMGTVEMTLEDYGAVREHDRNFFMLPQHPRSPGEEIVEHRNGYEIAQKPD